MKPDSRRRLFAGLVPALSALALAGCFGGRPPHVWWELEDPGLGRAGSAGPDAARATLSLAVEGLAAGALADGTALLYSRAPGMRAPYQYASWTERPAARLARLAQRRLQARGGFRDVSLAAAGAAPDLLLTLTLESLHHDLAGASGTMRLAASAQLLEWRARRSLGSRSFEIAEPVDGDDAAGAVQAANRAAARLLDALAPWVEADAAALSRDGRPAGR